MYPAFISLSNIDKGIKVITNKIGNTLSPWEMLLFTFISLSVSPPNVNSTFQFFIDFSITFLIWLATFKILLALHNPGMRCHTISFFYSLSKQHSSLSFFFCSSFFTILSIISWSLVPLLCLLQPFCSSSNSFSLSLCP